MKKWENELTRAFSREGVPNGQKTHEEMLNIPDIKEMQIKTALRFHLTPVRMATFKNTTTNKYW
jgi:hypothetical protein